MLRADETTSNNPFARLKHSNKVHNFPKYIELINSLSEAHKTLVGQHTLRSQPEA